MPGWMIHMVELLNSWVIRMLVVFSFAAHLALVLLAGVRRRRAVGVRIAILWAANQLGRSAATYELSNLALGSTPQELQLVTLWGAFLLLHAGGPDNITAYSLEDNVLSTRHMVEMILQVSAALFAMYKNIVVRSGAGNTMVWVSSFMFVMGIVKYWERAKAVQLANLENMRSSIKEEKKKKQHKETSGRSLRSVRRPRSCGEHDNEEALLVAHGLLDITKGAFVDSSVNEHQIPEYVARRREIFPESGWEMMYKVVDMELSLMYDILYTKAAMLHTWHGYAIRVASPFATATAFMLFWFDSKQGQRMADVVITYVLLAGTVLLDIRWLLRAVASTWTYSFLNDRPHCWLHHALLCTGRWRLLRRVIVSLNLFANKKPSSYRMWSGTIGQYNLLRECTCDEDETTSNYVSSVLKRIAPEGIWMEYEYHYLRGKNISTDHVRKQLFCRIWEDMKLVFPVQEPVQERVKVPPGAKFLPSDQEINIALDFTPDLQETILILHIATDILFWLQPDPDLIEASSESPTARQVVEAIKALSNYMMFLVVVRPSMLPGLALSSRYESVRDALSEIWKEKKNDPSLCTISTSTPREKRLALMLLELDNLEGRLHKMDSLEPASGFLSVLYDTSNILSEGAILAKFLLRPLQATIPKTFRKKFNRQFPDLMKFGECRTPKEVIDAIFKEWVRQLINVSIRCTRDSHAKQLGRGGELTTVVWILAEHARILRVSSPQ